MSDSVLVYRYGCRLEATAILEDQCAPLGIWEGYPKASYGLTLEDAGDRKGLGLVKTAGQSCLIIDTVRNSRL